MHAVSIPESALERGRLMGLAKPIDPSTTAVVVIDFQEFFTSEGQPMGNLHARDAIPATNKILEAVRETGGTVIVMQHSFATPKEHAEAEKSPVSLDTQELKLGSPSYELHPDLDVADSDIRMVKHRSSPLHEKAGTDLAQLLAERSVETLIITGVASNGCCDCLARDAFQHDFNVVMATDASAAMTDEEHNATLLNLAIYYAQTLDSNAISASLRAGVKEA